MLGLGSALSRSGKAGPTILRDGLVLKHDYNRSSVQPVSTGTAEFNGTSDHVQLTNAISNNVLSISAWVNVKEDDTIKSIFDTRDANDDGVSFLINDSERLQLQVNASDTVQDAAVQLTAGVWQHVAGTYDGTNLKLYIDGVLAKTTADAGGSETVTVTRPPRIGKKAYGNAQYFNGYMANVGVWSAALDQDQVKSIMLKDYAALSASEKTSLVSWWNLDEETKTDGTAGTGGVKDHEGSNHGTLT